MHPASAAYLLPIRSGGLRLQRVRRGAHLPDLSGKGPEVTNWCLDAGGFLRVRLGELAAARGPLGEQLPMEPRWKPLLRVAGGGAGLPLQWTAGAEHQVVVLWGVPSPYCPSDAAAGDSRTVRGEKLWYEETSRTAF